MKDPNLYLKNMLTIREKSITNPAYNIGSCPIVGKTNIYNMNGPPPEGGLAL